MSQELQIALAAVFLTVGLVTAGIAMLVLGRLSPERRRLEELLQPRGTPGGAGARGSDRALRDLSALVSRPQSDLGPTERRLLQAGITHPAAARIYPASEFVLPVVFGGLALLALGPGLLGYIGALLAAAAGHLLPGTIVWRRIEARKMEVEQGLPDALDLLVLCLEAGSSLDQAIVKASDELAIAYPTLAAEFRTVTTEMRAGKPRTEAFRNLAVRTKADEVRSLVAMLVQTDRFGTSIAQALRTHADVGRTKRRQRAEERAGKVGVKLVFPLVLCLFPALYVVLLGPAIIDYIEYFR